MKRGAQVPKFKEKPKGKVQRADKSSMLSPRQAAKLLKDRYVQQLDQNTTKNNITGAEIPF